MKRKTYKSIMVILMALAVSVLFAPAAFASDVYNEADYPAYFEKTMDKLHVLHAMVFDKSASMGSREKAKREFFKNWGNGELVPSLLLY